MAHNADVRSAPELRLRSGPPPVLSARSSRRRAQRGLQPAPRTRPPGTPCRLLRECASSSCCLPRRPTSLRRQTTQSVHLSGRFTVERVVAWRQSRQPRPGIRIRGCSGAPTCEGLRAVEQRPKLVTRLTRAVRASLRAADAAQRLRELRVRKALRDQDLVELPQPRLELTVRVIHRILRGAGALRACQLGCDLRYKPALNRVRLPTSRTRHRSWSPILGRRPFGASGSRREMLPYLRYAAPVGKAPGHRAVSPSLRRVSRKAVVADHEALLSAATPDPPNRASQRWCPHRVLIRNLRWRGDAMGRRPRGASEEHACDLGPYG